MTLPDERWRAVDQVREFLRNLPGAPRVPKDVKREALRLLKHYPGQYATADALKRELAEEATRGAHGGSLP